MTYFTPQANTVVYLLALWPSQRRTSEALWSLTLCLSLEHVSKNGIFDEKTLLEISLYQVLKFTHNFAFILCCNLRLYHIFNHYSFVITLCNGRLTNRCWNYLTTCYLPLLMRDLSLMYRLWFPRWSYIVGAECIPTQSVFKVLQSRAPNLYNF